MDMGLKSDPEGALYFDFSKQIKCSGLGRAGDKLR
jgi:hypothetical protein